MSEAFAPLPDRRYGVLYVDPPWDYKGQLQHAGPGSGDSGGAVRHYPTMTLAELKRLPVETIAADGARLFLWATNPHLDQGIELGKAWGFAWSSVAFVWDKLRVNPGFYTMSQCELCLLFHRGDAPPPEAPEIVREKRREHSRKPDGVRRRIERRFPDARRIELFARGAADGWDGWGLQA